MMRYIYIIYVSTQNLGVCMSLRIYTCFINSILKLLKNRLSNTRNTRNVLADEVKIFKSLHIDTLCSKYSNAHTNFDDIIGLRVIILSLI